MYWTDNKTVAISLEITMTLESKNTNLVQTVYDIQSPTESMQSVHHLCQ